MPIDDKYIIKRQGKDYVLYPGLLDEAHRRGLRSIETELHSWDGTEAIVTAKVSLDDDENVHEGRTFTGIGDANKNERGAPGEAPIRMAETRAKARALRDAINVADALFGDPEPEAEPQRPREAPRSAPVPQEAPPEGLDTTSLTERHSKARLPQDGDPIKNAQKTVLERLLWRRAEANPNADYQETIRNFEKYVGKRIADMTYGDANEHIEWLAQMDAPTAQEPNR